MEYMTVIDGFNDLNLTALDDETTKKIADFERLVKQIKAKEDELKKALLVEMEKQSLLKHDCDALTITYIEPTERETLDTKALREELPDIYDAYVKLSPVKPSVRIKLKG